MLLLLFIINYDNYESLIKLKCFAMTGRLIRSGLRPVLPPGDESANVLPFNNRSDYIRSFSFFICTLNFLNMLTIKRDIN